MGFSKHKIQDNTLSINMKQVKLVVSGRVQGVSFRASTKRKAVSLGLRGFV